MLNFALTTEQSNRKLTVKELEVEGITAMRITESCLR